MSTKLSETCGSFFCPWRSRLSNHRNSRPCVNPSDSPNISAGSLGGHLLGGPSSLIVHPWGILRDESCFVLNGRAPGFLPQHAEHKSWSTPAAPTRSSLGLGLKPGWERTGFILTFVFGALPVVKGLFDHRYLQRTGTNKKIKIKKTQSKRLYLFLAIRPSTRCSAVVEKSDHDKNKDLFVQARRHLCGVIFSLVSLGLALGASVWGSCFFLGMSAPENLKQNLKLVLNGNVLSSAQRRHICFNTGTSSVSPRCLCAEPGRQKRIECPARPKSGQAASALINIWTSWARPEINFGRRSCSHERQAPRTEQSALHHLISGTAITWVIRNR